MVNPYGNAHQRARRDALASFRDGTACWRCKRPMHLWQRLDLDHVRPIVLGGANGMTVLHMLNAIGLRVHPLAIGDALAMAVKTPAQPA